MPRHSPSHHTASTPHFPLHSFWALYAVSVAGLAWSIQLGVAPLGAVLGSAVRGLSLPVFALAAAALGAWLSSIQARRGGAALLGAMAVLALSALWLVFVVVAVRGDVGAAVKHGASWWWYALALTAIPAALCGVFAALFAAGLRRHCGIAPSLLVARMLLLGSGAAALGLLISVLPSSGRFDSNRLPAIAGLVLGACAVFGYALFRRFSPLGSRRPGAAMPALAMLPSRIALPLAGVAAGAALGAWHDLALAWDAWYDASLWLAICCLLALAAGVGSGLRRGGAWPPSGWLLWAAALAVATPWLLSAVALLGDTIALGASQSDIAPAYGGYRALAGLCSVLLAVPMAALGAVLPGLLGGAVQRVGHDGGWGTALATLLLGSAVGIAWSQGYLLPAWGPAAGLLPAVVLLSYAAVLKPLSQRFGSCLAACATVVVVLVLVLGVVVAPSPSAQLAERRAQRLGDGAQLLWQRRGHAGETRLYRYPELSLRALFVGGRQRAVTRDGRALELPLAAALGLLSAPAARRVLAIGAELNAATVLASRELLQLDLLVPDDIALEAVRELGAPLDRLVLDPRVFSHNIPPRRFLLAQGHRYPLILSAEYGDGGRYTQAFYRLVHARLKDGGIFVQRLPPLGMTAFVAVYKALNFAFTDLSLFVGGGGLVVVARRGGTLPPLPSQLWQHPSTAAFFARHGLAHANDVQLRFIGNRLWLNSYYPVLSVPSAQDRLRFVSRHLARARFAGAPSPEQRQFLALRGSDGISLSAVLSQRPLHSSTQTPSVASDPPDLYLAARARALAEALAQGDIAAIPTVAALSRPCAAGAPLCGDDWPPLIRHQLLPLLPWLSDAEAIRLGAALGRWRKGRELGAVGEAEHQLLLALCRRDWEQVGDLAEAMLPPPDVALSTAAQRRHARTALLAHFLELELQSVLRLANRLGADGRQLPFAVYFAIASTQGQLEIFKRIRIGATSEQ